MTWFARLSGPPEPRRRPMKRRSPTPRRQRRGVVLIAALVCLAVATAIILSTTGQSLAARRHGRIQRQLRQTEYLLEAGVRRAVAALQADKAYSGETWQPTGALPDFEAVQVEIRVAPLADQSSERQVDVLAKLSHSASWAYPTQRSHTFTHRFDDQALSPALE